MKAQVFVWICDKVSSLVVQGKAALSIPPMKNRSGKIASFEIYQVKAFI